MRRGNVGSTNAYVRHGGAVSNDNNEVIIPRDYMYIWLHTPRDATTEHKNIEDDGFWKVRKNVLRHYGRAEISTGRPTAINISPRPAGRNRANDLANGSAEQFGIRSGARCNRRTVVNVIAVFNQ